MQPGSPLLRISALFFALALANGYAQNALRCSPTATNLIVRAEGLAEPSGDIVFTCTGGTAGLNVTSNITLNYSVPVTNRINGAGSPDAQVSVDTGAGPLPVGVAPTLLSAGTLAFNGVSLTIPASGNFVIRITNVRLAVAVFGPNRPVTASVSTTALPLTNASVTVATSSTGLLATYATSGISCYGSPLPANPTFAGFLSAGTRFSSTRVTEGFAGAFIPKDAASDTGTRILIRYSSFPAGARVFIPDYVAGNDSMIPTAAGDLGGLPSGGAYSPTGGGTLLLARVSGADATGMGGAPIVNAALLAQNSTFNSVTEIPLSNGAGTAVYEVIDANSNIQEYAQFPTFITLAASANQTPAIAFEGVSLAPTSNISTAMAGLPVPRFNISQPPNDCQAVGDCNASYFPILSATAANLQFSSTSSSTALTQYILVNNTGGGNLFFTTSISYQGTGGWLTVTNESGGTNHTTLRLDANPNGLAQGTYQATVTVDGGPAGVKTFTYTFTVGPPQILVSSIVNAASFQAGPLVPGSLTTIKGSNLSGKAVSVTFNGIAGTVLYSDAKQINVQVPAALASITSAQVVVSVDGNSSQPSTVAVANINPGIFGVLNQDNSINSSSNPAASGTVLQIFATGLISPVTSGPVVTGLGNQGIPTLYSGGFPNGLQQVNAQLPANASSIPGNLVVCGTSSSGQFVCSPVFTIYVR